MAERRESHWAVQWGQRQAEKRVESRENQRVARKDPHWAEQTAGQKEHWWVDW